MRRVWSLGVVLLLGTGSLCAQDDSFASELKEAQQQLAKGKVQKAKSLFEELLDAVDEPNEADRPPPAIVREARLGVFTIALRLGKYAEVADGVAAWPEAERAPGSLWLQVEAERKRGRIEKAMALLDTRDDYESLWWRGALLQDLGKRDAAQKSWQAAVEKVATRPLNVRELLAVARAKIALGGRDNIGSASQDLVSAVALAPDEPAPRVALAELKFLVYAEAAGFPSGEQDLKKVLDRNGEVEDALLLLYRIRSANFQKDPSQSEEYLSRALAQNPSCVPALVERGSVLIGDRRFEEAIEPLDKALSIHPRDKQALSHRAAAAWLAHDQTAYDELAKKVLELDSACADLPCVLGDHLVTLYRFKDSIPFYEQALALDAQHVRSLHGLARACIYTGEGKKAIPLLDRAKKAQDGFVNAWRNNALAVEGLLAEQYESIDTGNFELVLHKQDLDTMKGYLVPLADEALATLGRKYEYRPEAKVRIEVFHEWADFSVRTIGFRGFTALGACFGRFITMASPGDEDLRGLDFMWTATLWHEYAHVLTLGISKHRVPRWLTEGISVHEEKQRNATWERGMERDLLDAWHNKEIYPLRLLNQAFRSARILFGYYQGGLIVDYLTQEHGFAKVVEMVRRYGDDTPQEKVFRDTFGYATSEFDKRFLDHVWKTKLAQLRITPRYSDRTTEALRGRIAADANDLEARAALGWAMAQRGNPVDAGQQLGAVLRKDPKHPGALLLQAWLLNARKLYAEATAAYQAAFAAGAEDFDARMAHGELLARAGDTDSALQSFQLAKRCWPACTDQQSSPHLRVARLLRKLGRDEEAMMEIKSFCRMTGRAFAPRLEVAAFEKAQKNRESEARFLEEANAIDPFMRQLHLDLADAYAALDKKDLAIKELQVALAVRPELDRKYLDRQKAGEPPAADDPVERADRARVCVRIAKLCQEALRDAEIGKWLDRAEKEAVGTDAVDEVGEAKRALGR